MYLYLNADNPHDSCESVDMSLIEFLSWKTTLSDSQFMRYLSNQKSHLKPKLTSKEEKQSFAYPTRQREMFTKILNNPYSTHPIKNTYSNIDFGSWKSGIFDTTHDDFMHSAESGLFV